MQLHHGLLSMIQLASQLRHNGLLVISSNLQELVALSAQELGLLVKFSFFSYQGVVFPSEIKEHLLVVLVDRARLRVDVDELGHLLRCCLGLEGTQLLLLLWWRCLPERLLR